MAEKSSIEKYQNETKTALKVIQTDRGIREYVEILGFSSEEEFLRFLPKDALALDLGSGMGKLARELKTKRPDLTIVSLNPALAEEKFAKKQKRYELGSGNWVRDIFERKSIDAKKRILPSASAINPRLPFKDASFDVVFDSMSSVYYTHVPSVMSSEIIRVLKPGADAAVGPLIFKKDSDELGRHLQKLDNITFETKTAKTIGYGFGVAFRIHKIR